MDRNQRSRNQKKCTSPQGSAQPSQHQKRPAAAQQRPAGSQQWPKGSGQRPAKQPERQPPKQQQKRPRPNRTPKAGVPFQRATGAAPRYPRGTAANPPPQGHHRGAVRFGSAGGRHCAFHQPVVQGDGFPGGKCGPHHPRQYRHLYRTTTDRCNRHSGGDNLYGFSTKEKSDQLLAQMPYLDVAVVTRQAPAP